jgi:hypothetical protein
VNPAVLAALLFTPTPTATIAVPAGSFVGKVTPYADSLAGNSMGCSGTGPFSPSDPTVVAVGPALYTRLPCGTRLSICGTAGCITATRKDACPGCAGNNLDVSRAAYKLLCGSAPYDCPVTFRVIP